MTAQDSAATDEAPRAPLPPLWRNRDYMLLWSGQLVSTLGSGISGIALTLLALSITGSAAQAGIVGALGSVPYLVFSLPAGALVDRWNRKKVMMLCDSGRAISLASIPIAAAVWHVTFVQLCINALIEGTLFVFFNISEVACLPRVVPKEQIPSAGAQNEAGQVAAGLIAPPLGGLLYQSVSRTLPFAVDAVSYVASVVSLFFIRTEFQGERTATRRSLGAEIAEGVRWLWRQPLIRFMAFLTGGLNFCNSATSLILIVLAKQHGASAGTIGLMFSIGSIGGFLGALVAPRIQARYGFAQVIISTVWIGALLWPLFAIAGNPFLLGLILTGMFSVGPVYNAVQFSYRLRLIPDQLQGRVNSAFRLLAFGGMPVGSALAGAAIQAFGAVTTVLIFAVMQILLATLATANWHVRNAQPIAAAAMPA